MRPSRFAIHHPVLTIMVMLIVILLGGVSLTRLPVDLMPDITYPRLSISTTYENASPEEMEKLVTRPVEQALSAVPGVEEVSSISTEGQSSVRVAFTWGTDLDAAANDIRDRLDRITGRLPEDASRPRLHKFDLASFPVLIMGASSGLDPVQMREIIDEQVKYRIERVPGVASLSIWGGHSREIHINLHADKVKALDLPLDGILARIRAENVDVPAGTVDRGNFEVTVRTLGTYESVDELRETVIAVREGAPVRLGEVADVDDTSQRITRVVRVNGRPGVRLAINKQSGTNTVEVARRALEEVERINRDIPQINLTTIIDSSEYIRRAIANVGRSAVLGGALAVLVLFFFLRDLRSTGVIAIAIPVSIVATFGLMHFGGLTLNIMTLGGLALGIGMLVDGSIVVLENIHRLRESGGDPFRAAAEGTEEVTAAICASTLTTLAVFLPLIFMRGMAGVMFKQLSFVVAFALLCSLAVALTVVPMLAARAARGAGAARDGGRGPEGRDLQRTGRRGGFFAGLERAYGRILRFALDNRALVTAGAVALFAGSIALVPRVGVELMPATDEGQVRVEGEMEIGTRLNIVDGKFKEIERIVNESVPEIKSSVVSVGGSHWRGNVSHTGRVRIALKPASERDRSSDEIAADLRKRLSGMPGITVRTRTSGGMLARMMTRGMGGDDRIQVEIRGYDIETAGLLAERVKHVIGKVPGATEPRVSREVGSPEELVVVNREKAADMKLTVSQIANALQTILSGTRAGNFREGGREHPIRVQIKGAEKLALRDVLDLTIVNAEGHPVVLRNVVKLQPRRGPVRIERKDQERVVTVSAEIEGRDMGSVVTDIDRAIRTIPPRRGFQILQSGDYEEQQKAFYGEPSRFLLRLGLGEWRLGGLRMSLVLALVLVYMVMAGLFESLLDPFVVMFSVPLAVIGVVLILLLTGTTFNIQSFIGCIMLCGIVVNNAILLVDHTNLLRRRDGMPLRAAIEEAGRRRLRPILMTALTTSLALTPLAIGLGEGGEAQAPMARAVIGGLLSSSLITLVFVPTIYSLFERGGTGDASPAEAPTARGDPERPDERS